MLSKIIVYISAGLCASVILFMWYLIILAFFS